MQLRPCCCCCHAKQRKELSALREAVTTICQVMSKPRANLHPGRVLTEQTPEDGLEAYLEVFVRTAISEKFPDEDWNALLESFVTGDAQRACQDLAPPRMGRPSTRKRGATEEPG